MTRPLLMLAALLLPAMAGAQTRTLSCPEARPGDHVCDGFTVSGGGWVSASVFTTPADFHGLALYSPTDFTLVSVDLQSIIASPNDVVILGYKRNVVDVPFTGFPYPGSYGQFSYIARFSIGSAFPLGHLFNWTDLAAIKFDGSGGPTPGAPIPIHDAFDYRISNVVVSVNTVPEPSSILLVATGLLGLLVVARRRGSAPRSASVSS